MFNTLVGVIGSSLIGSDPFDRRCWSGCSYYFFKGLQDRGRLKRAFGVDVNRWERFRLIARNFHVDRAVWRSGYHLDPGYRELLTTEIRKRLHDEDFNHSFVQVGALYDVPAILNGRTRCYSFHDGNVAQSLKSPHFPRGVSSRTIDSAINFERQVYQKIDKIFAMSEYLRESFIEDFGVPADRVFSIGGGINLDAIPDAPIGKNFDSQEILFIGIDFDRKGGWDVLHAFKPIHAKYPRARLHIIGPRNLEIPDDLHRGVEYHGLLDKQNPSDMETLSNLFHRSSLFVMPSHYEPFGVAPLEAMVHEIPCVVTNAWALKEMVRPGINGDLVEIGNVEQLSDTLGRMLGDPAELERLGKTGRQKVIDYYTWDKVVDRFLAFVDS